MFSRLSPLFSRAVLVLVSILLAAIASRYLFDPVSAAANVHMLLGSPNAAMQARIGLGAFPLAIAIFAFGCGVTGRMALPALVFIAVLMTTVLAVRVAGAEMSGFAGLDKAPFIGEAVFIFLSALAIGLEFAAKPAAGPQPQ